MKYLVLIPLLFAAPAWGQSSLNEIINTPLLKADEALIVHGIYDEDRRLTQIAGS